MRSDALKNGACSVSLKDMEAEWCNEDAVVPPVDSIRLYDIGQSLPKERTLLNGLYKKGRGVAELAKNLANRRKSGNDPMSPKDTSVHSKDSSLHSKDSSLHSDSDTFREQGGTSMCVPSFENAVSATGSQASDTTGSQGVSPPRKLLGGLLRKGKGVADFAKKFAELGRPVSGHADHEHGGASAVSDVSSQDGDCLRRSCSLDGIGESELAQAPPYQARGILDLEFDRGLDADAGDTGHNDGSKPVKLVDKVLSVERNLLSGLLQKGKSLARTLSRRGSSTFASTSPTYKQEPDVPIDLLVLNPEGLASPVPQTAIGSSSERDAHTENGSSAEGAEDDAVALLKLVAEWHEPASDPAPPAGGGKGVITKALNRRQGLLGGLKSRLLEKGKGVASLAGRYAARRERRAGAAKLTRGAQSRSNSLSLKASQRGAGSPHSDAWSPKEQRHSGPGSGEGVLIETEQAEEGSDFYSDMSDADGGESGGDEMTAQALAERKLLMNKEKLLENEVEWYSTPGGGARQRSPVGDVTRSASKGFKGLLGSGLLRPGRKVAAIARRYAARGSRHGPAKRDPRTVREDADDDQAAGGVTPGADDSWRKRGDAVRDADGAGRPASPAGDLPADADADWGSGGAARDRGRGRLGRLPRNVVGKIKNKMRKDFRWARAVMCTLLSLFFTAGSCQGALHALWSALVGTSCCRRKSPRPCDDSAPGQCRSKPHPVPMRRRRSRQRAGPRDRGRRGGGGGGG